MIFGLLFIVGMFVGWFACEARWLREMDSAMSGQKEQRPPKEPFEMPYRTATTQQVSTAHILSQFDSRGKRSRLCGWTLNRSAKEGRFMGVTHFIKSRR